jgi:diguanylate cyclase (GGDEF)-like protein
MPSQSEARYWVCCIDDDRSFLESAGRLIARTLEEHPPEVPCEVELASNADEFAEVAAEMAEEGAELAVLITDQIMPDCSGLELIERMKADHPATSCVLLTGYAGLESARYAINKALLDRYVCKPIEDMEAFSEMLVSELERFHLRRTETLQAAQIVRQAEELRRANELLERMKKTAESVAYFSRELRTLDLDEVLDLVSDKAPLLFGAKSCFLFVPDRNNKLILWRERRVKCLAPVPPNLDVNQVMREAITTRKTAITLNLEWCSGAPDDSCTGTGAVVMPLRVTRREARGLDEPGSPAMLCLCGIDDVEALSEQEIEYKVLLINDILGANIANAMAYSETARLANEDSLTGAKTRRVLEDLIRAEWERYQRYHSEFCIALMDVDHLKQINDSHGHAAGDEVLQAVVRLANEKTRRCDTVARFGGDEFCILLPETPLEGARTVVGRVKQAIEDTPLPLTGEPASVSIGLAGVSGKRSPEEVLGSADRALYEAKRAGRGRLSAAAVSVETAAQGGPARSGEVQSG